MTLSAVEICNLALDNVPAAPINSLNDNTIAAEACRRHFTQAVEELMEMGEWGFAIKRAVLSEIVNEREGDWDRAYAAPNDMAFPIRMRPSGGGGLLHGRSMEFDFSGGVLWASSGDVVLEYITRSPSFSSMTAMFRNALACVLASKIVMAIKRDRNEQAALLQQAEVWRDRALARSLNSNGQQQTYGDNFIPTALRGAFDDVPAGGKPYRPSSDPEYGGSWNGAAFVDSLFD